jgi:hypothetical protein
MVVITGSLLNYLVVFSAFNHSNLAEVRQKVSPHHVVLVDVGALNLRHRDKVVSQQEAIVCAHSSHLRQTLV